MLFNRSILILYINKDMVIKVGFDFLGLKLWEEFKDYVSKMINKLEDIYGFEMLIDIWFYEVMVM